MKISWDEALEKKGPLLLLSVILLAFVVWFPSLPKEFIHDDFSLIVGNGDLQAVKTLSDVAAFKLKPSKPVANVFLALGQWIGGGVRGQRIISLFFHLATVGLLFLIIITSAHRCGFDFPSYLALWSVLIFATCPIHSESLSVAWFRMDILGTFFTFGATLFAMGWGTGTWRKAMSVIGIFLCVGLAGLSKEIYVVIAPVMAIAFFLLTREGRHEGRHAQWFLPLIIAATGIVWFVCVYLLLKLDVGVSYSYRGVIGAGVLSIKTHLVLAILSIGENALKVITGWNLTTVPLSQRLLFLSRFQVSSYVMALVFMVLAMGWAVRKGGWYRAWGIVGGFVVTVYALVPNINLGAERYWYLPAAAVICVACASILRWAEGQKTAYRLMIALLLSAFTIFQLVTLKSRLWLTRTRFEHSVAETETNPLVATAWSNVAAALIENQNSVIYARPFVERAKVLGANHPRVLLTEFLFYFKQRDLRKAESVVVNLDRALIAEPRKLGLAHYQLGLMKGERGDCPGAIQSFTRAIALDEDRQMFHRALSSARKSVAGKTGGCKLAKG